jgi:hypothetical protein
MEVDLAYAFLNWFMQIDLLCIVCNWDPATQSWVPAAGAAAAGTGLGLNNLFGPFYDLPPLDPGLGSFDPTFGQPYSNTSNDDRIAADQAEQERLDREYRATHPGATTAGPAQPTTNEQMADFFHRAIRKKITGQGEP